jgi:hypothetical protein
VILNQIVKNESFEIVFLKKLRFENIKKKKIAFTKKKKKGKCVLFLKKKKKKKTHTHTILKSKLQF